MTLKLHSLRVENPGAPTLVILHGLLGASRNWSSVIKDLGERFDVHALDLRNHGHSPHAESMRWEELSGDVRAYLERNELSKVVLLGHSLGGKVAMRLACRQPDRIGSLMIIDIAAKCYPPYHEAEFRAMKRIAVEELESRREAEELLAGSVKDWAMRQFLLTNLVRDPSGSGFRWQVNLEALYAGLPHIRQNSLDQTDQYPGPVLLVRGAKSDFIEDGDAEMMRHWFPHLQERTLPLGHNPHIEDRNVFLELFDQDLRVTL